MTRRGWHEMTADARGLRRSRQRLMLAGRTGRRGAKPARNAVATDLVARHDLEMGRLAQQDIAQASCLRRNAPEVEHSALCGQCVGMRPGSGKIEQHVTRAPRGNARSSVRRN